jgi:hypothetical protein
MELKQPRSAVRITKIEGPIQWRRFWDRFPWRSFLFAWAYLSVLIWALMELAK